MKYEKIQNIIFDLGQVIFNINYNLTLQAFGELGVPDIENLFTTASNSEFFGDYERGQISDADFRNGLRELFDHEVSDDEIDDAWNAMLLNLPEERITLLQKVKNNYRIFLLSNTNDLHLVAVESILGVEQFHKLLQLFEKVYFSNKINMRKPELRVFDLILEENDLNVSETLFIDDLPHFIEGGKKAGLSTIHLVAPTTLVDLFTDKGFLK